jgi:serine/threonine protein kinase
MVRCNSGCNRIKINTDEPIPYNKNILKNNEINSGKIPIKKKINNYRGKSFNRRGESTSCDSNEQVNNNKDSNKKTEENSSDKNKKIIPGKFNINHYIIKKQIGQGTFGQIFLVEDKNNHNKYALKKIIAGSSNDINNIQKEYQILLDIQNNVQDINVVNIFGLSKYKLDITTYVLYVLMELASTDWEKEILSRKATRKYYSEKELIKILSSLIKSLSILEKQNISHRDIKPQNVLVFYDKYLNKIYKLADFGEAKELLKDEKPTNKQTLRGTELYMSPILFYGLRRGLQQIEHNTYKSDVFSLGMCLFYAACLSFDGPVEIREVIDMNIKLQILNKYMGARYSQKLIKILYLMLQTEESIRPDFILLQDAIIKYGL